MENFSSLLVAVLFLTTQFSLADTTCVHYPGASELIYERPTLANQINTDHFKIHWENPTTSTYADNAANYAEYAYQRICMEMGWQIPPNDDNRGGDNKYDIYLVNESYIPKSNGLTQPEIIGNWTYEWSPSFILIRNTIETENQLKMVIAHEFNHASQLAYSCRDGSTDTWFLENTAVWVAEIVYNYSYKYYEHYFYTATSNGPDPLDHPEFGIHTSWGDGIGEYNYAGFLWPKFLAEWTGDNAIVRKIWQRLGQNPGDNILSDINYILSAPEYESSLNEAARYYAEWRYFTGTRDDGEHFNNADELPTSVLFPTNILQQINGFGGTVFLQFIPLLGLMELSFNGEDNYLWAASIIQHKFEPPSYNLIFPLDNNSAGSTDVDTEGCLDIVLLPVLLRDEIRIDYTYNNMDIDAGKVFFSNKKGLSLSAGNLELDNNTTIPSGGYRWLRVSSTPHNIKTLNERLQDSPLYKHNNWNGDLNKFYLNNSFTVQNTNLDQYQNANFIPLTSATIRYVIDGVSFNDGVPIGFNDPWYVKDVNDNQSGMGDFISPPSPYNPTGKFNQTTGGVFLNQGYNPVNQTWTPPYYSVKVEEVFEAPLYNTGVPAGRIHKFYFKGWTGTEVQYENENSLQTGVVFKDEILNEIPKVEADLKGTQLSSQTNAYNYNSQRKYVKTDDGYLHLVYESMGSVWYETSSDNGVSWKIQNNGSPIALVGKQPSLDFNKTLDQWNEELCQIVMVWQEKSGINSKIRIAYFDRSVDTPDGLMNWRDTKDLGYVWGTYETTNCTPVVSFAFNMYTAVYKNGPSGYLLCRYSSINSSSGVITVLGSATTLTNTDSYSVNPSIAVNKVNGPIVIVWEQIQNDELSSIKYAGLNGSQISGFVSTISTNSGSPLNFSPSISFAYNSPVVSWTGARNPGDGIDKRKAITRRGTTWGSFQVAGTDVNFVNNNSATGTTEKTVISWSEGTTNPVTKWMRRDDTLYTIPQTLSNSGIQSQICSGTNFQTMSAMVFKNTTIPYYFLKSTTDFSTDQEGGGGGLNKITQNDTMVTFGRGGIASINDIEFVFEIGDVLVGDSTIKFIGIPDTIV